ncbi:trehalose-phosphatase [Vulgatibacter sp.]|uniref:trehalose-phosphatase n=1 Tax=Vulgatibacter sp. TaxID=1971226 RepID=UPI00356B19CD
MELHFDAAVFDLDGVVTRTARLHFAAWKESFDRLLAERGLPLFTREDYLAYVDGKPRRDGIRALLAARGLPGDEAVVEQLATEKNDRFRTVLAQEGPEVFPGALELLRALRARGVRTVLASSSRNAGPVVEAAGIADLFDARVDGITSAARGLAGKPAPDLFLAAAREVGAQPERCVLLEDAVAGVEAGAAGCFCLVVGVDRGGNHLPLRLAGADLVVQGLRELSVDAIERWFVRASDRRPSALTHLDGLQRELQGRRPAIFLDYDGTLAPIVDHPEDAVMPAQVRADLEAATTRCPVVLVSGRRLADVAALVDLPALTFAGSHGFEIRGPTGSHAIRPESQGAIHAAAAALRARLGAIEGILVEDKSFAVAIHFRLADPAFVPAVERMVDEVGAGLGLRKTHGKMIFELRPDVDWDKGRAVRFLLETLGLGDAVPIYVGDDVTDEDAFRALADDGISILVSDEPRPTAARWSLQDPAEVGFFLRLLCGGEP